MSDKKNDPIADDANQDIKQQGTGNIAGNSGKRNESQLEKHGKELWYEVEKEEQLKRIGENNTLSSSERDILGEQEDADTKILSEKQLEEISEKVIDAEKVSYFSKMFTKIEKKVLTSIDEQKADDALREVTIGALYLGGSDMHYDCFEETIILRFRIDGVLVDIFELTHSQYKLLLERLKYSSSLKLNITNVPQDGKYEVDIEGKRIGVRVSTLPTKYGENIVSRVLDSDKAIIDFEQLGFFWTSKRMVNRAISKRNGLILVTGPTGSGKTTTLYTMVSKLNTREKKVITLEDPIEYELPGIVQSEVDEKLGFTFKKGLKALLRQDPDIIMVGEIRDYDTLNIATSASLTGHLVLSTLHTKSAAETLDRIINMGLPPYILASAIDTIIAQRLVRKICTECKREKEKTPEEKAIITAMMKEIGMGSVPNKSVKLYEGTGCETCNGSGYKGRIGIFETISFTHPIREIIREGGSVKEVIAEARKGDLITMKEDGVLKAIKGHTTITEILRVI